MLRSAVKSDASQVVFTHNQPKRNLKTVKCRFGYDTGFGAYAVFRRYKMLDHIIVADGKCMSILPYLKAGGMNAKINREIKKNNRR